MKIVLVIHNVRSAHNVGSLLRSADGFGANKVYMSGYTPFPMLQNDSRLPHIAEKADRQIRKTSLGAENSVKWEHYEEIKDVITNLKNDGYQIAALEQTDKSQSLNTYKPKRDIAVIVGNEVDGIDQQTLKMADNHIEIPMGGKKESFNVSIAGAVAMYHFTTMDMS